MYKIAVTIRNISRWFKSILLELMWKIYAGKQSNVNTEYQILAQGYRNLWQSDWIYRKISNDWKRAKTYVHKNSLFVRVLSGLNAVHVLTSYSRSILNSILILLFNFNSLNGLKYLFVTFASLIHYKLKNTLKSQWKWHL